MTGNIPSLVFGCFLDGKGGSRPLDTWPLQFGPEVQGAPWVHFDTAEPTANDWLINDSGIEPVIIDALTAGETRPRSFTTEKGLFLTLRGVNTNPGEDAEDMVSIRLWIEPHRIVSTTRRRLLSVRDVYNSLEQGTGPATPGALLVAVIERLADRIGDFVDEIETQLAEAEDRLVDGSGLPYRQKLGALRRQIAAVRRFLAPQRDALERLYRQPGDFFAAADAMHLREETDRLVRYLEDLDLERERAVVLQEEILSQLAQEQNSRMYMLSIVAAIFLPLTFITGMLGMNVGGLPGLNSDSGFLVSIISMVAASILIGLILKWKKWL